MTSRGEWGIIRQIFGEAAMRSVALLARLNDQDLVVDSLKARLGEIAEALREPAALTAARRRAGRSRS